MRELVERRSFTTKHFELEGNLYRMETHVGQIHFRDGALKDGVFRDIDTVLDYNARSASFQMTKASYEAEIGLYGDVRFHDIDHSLEFRLPNPNRIEGVPYAGSAFGKLGKGLIWRNIIQDGGHQIVEARNGSLAKIFHFDKPPKSPVIKFQVIISEGVKFSDGKADFDFDRDPKCELVDAHGEFRSKGKVSFIRRPQVWNHRGESTGIKLRFVQFGRETWALKLLPQEFIDKTFTEAGAWLETDTTTSYFSGSGDGTYWWSGTQDYFSTIRAAAGTGSNTTGSSYQQLTQYSSGTAADNFIDNYRSYFPFDTSSLGYTAEVSAAVLNFYCDLVSNNFSSASYGVTKIDHPTSAGYAIANWDGVEQATNRDSSQWTSSAYNTFTLNSTGRGNINKAGTTMFGGRNGADLGDVYSWSGSKQFAVYVRMSEYTGTGSDPYLDATYTLSLGLASPIALLTNNAVYRM